MTIWLMLFVIIKHIHHLLFQIALLHIAKENLRQLFEIKWHVWTSHFLRWHYLAASEMQPMISIFWSSWGLSFLLHWRSIRSIKRCMTGIYIIAKINKFHLAKLFLCRTIYITRTSAWDFRIFLSGFFCCILFVGYAIHVLYPLC